MLTLTPILTIILGALLLLTGLLFKILHWPDLFQGLYSGWVVMLAGCVWLYLKNKALKNKNTHQTEN